MAYDGYRHCSYCISLVSIVHIALHHAVFYLCRTVCTILHYITNHSTKITLGGRETTKPPQKKNNKKTITKNRTQAIFLLRVEWFSIIIWFQVGQLLQPVRWVSITCQVRHFSKQVSHSFWGMPTKNDRRQFIHQINFIINPSQTQRQQNLDSRQFYHTTNNTSIHLWCLCLWRGVMLGGIAMKPIRFSFTTLFYIALYHHMMNHIPTHLLCLGHRHGDHARWHGHDGNNAGHQLRDGCCCQQAIRRICCWQCCSLLLMLLLYAAQRCVAL